MSHPNLLRSHQLIQALSDLLGLIKEDRPISPDDGRKCLEQLLELEALYDQHGATTLREISKRMQAQMFWEIEPGQPMGREDKQSLLRACDAMRIQVLAVSAWCALRPSQEAADNFFAFIESDAFASHGAIHFGSGGVTYTTFDGHMIILLSSISSIAQSHDILAELTSIYDKTPESANWVIDFSGATALTPQFETVLTSYKNQLANTGRKLLVCWLSPSLVSNVKLDFINGLDLIEVGGYYFSSPNNV